VFALFAGLAVISTWPLARFMGGSLAQGREAAATVPLHGTWTVWWNCDRCAHLWEGYWDAPIFQPASSAFTFSEPMPLSALAAPLVWATGDAVLACNAFLLLALTLNGYSAFELLLRVHQNLHVAIAGGAVVALLPFVHHELGILQLVPLFGIVWTIHALSSCAAKPTIGRACLLGLSFGATYLLCSHYGLFLSVLLLVAYAWLFGAQLGSRKTWACLAASVLVAGLLISPIVFAQFRSTAALTRDAATIRRFSADADAYVTSPWAAAIPQPARLGGGHAFPAFPGAIKLSLAALGIAIGLRIGRLRSWTLFCISLAATAFVLSMGTKLSLGGWSAYGTLTALPGFAQVRSPFRFVVFVQLMIAFLAAQGLLVIVLCGRRSDRKATLLKATLILILGGTATIELWPPRQRLFEVPSIDRHAAWLNWLDKNTPPDTVIACVPFPVGKGVVDYEQTAIWMYWQTQHRRKIVNGYSGFFPDSFLELKAVMVDFPDPASLERLRQANVAYCVVDRAATPPKTLRRVDSHVELELEFQDQETGMALYRLMPETPRGL
jgi:hypothetical protein